MCKLSGKIDFNWVKAPRRRVFRRTLRAEERWREVRIYRGVSNWEEGESQLWIPRPPSFNLGLSFFFMVSREWL